jgi:hypothetical protein
LDFAKVLSEVARFLDAQGARWGVAGAVALQAYGIPRGTADLDLVVEENAKGAAVRFLESLGYDTLHSSEGFSNHLHRERIWGRVDLIYLDPHTADVLFARAERHVIFPGLTAAVPRPEHLAAMKVQAIKNNPDRYFQDMADIKALLELPEVDAEEIRGYFEKQGLGQQFDAIQRPIARPPRH